MGLGHSPRIVTDGLVLALDAQNSKSWKSGTTWTDASRNGNDVTLTGGISHSDGPFPEAGYVEFDGSTEYLSIADSADLRLGTGTFTIEAWIYPHTVSPTYNSSIVVKGSSSAAATWQFDISNTSKLRFQYDASSSFSSSSSLVANVWTHVAVVREGTGTNETKLYINGVLDTTGTVASDFSTTDTMKIGRNRGGGAVTYYNGYISNLRIIKGTALYTSNFTPPSSPLTAVTNTTLLCCQGATNVDASPSAHSFQVIIGVPTLTSVGPSASKYFEFNGGYAVTSSNTDFLFGTEEFAMEWWEYFTGGGGYIGHIGVFDSSRNTPMMWTLSGSFVSYVLPNGWQSVAMSPLSNQWAHYVVTGVTGNIRFYQNGELKDTTTWNWSATSTTSNFSIACGWGQSWQMPGKMSSVRVYKGRSLSTEEVTQNYNALKGRYV